MWLLAWQDGSGYRWRFAGLFNAFDDGQCRTSLLSDVPHSADQPMTRFVERLCHFEEMRFHCHCHCHCHYHYFGLGVPFSFFSIPVCDTTLTLQVLARASQNSSHYVTGTQDQKLPDESKIDNCLCGKLKMQLGSRCDLFCQRSGRGEKFLPENRLKYIDEALQVKLLNFSLKPNVLLMLLDIPTNVKVSLFEPTTERLLL